MEGQPVDSQTHCLNLFGTGPSWPCRHQNLSYGVLFIMEPIHPAGLLQSLYLTKWLYVGLRWMRNARLRRKVKNPPPFLAGDYFMTSAGALT